MFKLLLPVEPAGLRAPGRLARQREAVVDFVFDVPPDVPAGELKARYEACEAMFTKLDMSGMSSAA